MKPTIEDGPTSLAAAAAIFDKEGRVLLVRENYGQRRWGLPGGQVEDGESPWDAAAREVQEETGLSFTPEFLIATYFISARRPGHRFVFGGTCDGDAAVPDSGEIAELTWFEPTSLPAPMTDTGPLGVRDAVDGRRGHFERVERA